MAVRREPHEDYGTYWGGVPVDTMWQWVNRDLTAQWEQADAWLKSSELAYLHKERLLTYRAKLAEAWNPATSKAAAAYLSKLDDLITSVDNMAQVSSANHLQANELANAVFDAKRKLKPVYDTYRAAQGQIDVMNSGVPQPTPAPPVAGSKPPATVVTEQRSAAIQIMTTLAGELTQAQFRMEKPTDYRAPLPWRDNETSNGGGNLGPVVIPPVMPIPALPSYQPPSGPLSPVTAPTGPDLSGLNPTPPGLPSGPSPLPTGPVTGLPSPGGPLPTGIIGGPQMPGMPGGGMGRGALPAGGIIGAAPGMVPARTSGGAGSGMRANPPGGLIGGGIAGRPGSAAAARAGARGALTPPLTGMAGRAGRGQDETGEDFDPDTMWEVAQGVEPVVDAPHHQGPHDPGPAIGLNR